MYLYFQKSHLVRIFLDVYISEDACSMFLAHSTSLTYASISKNLIYFASLPLICLFFLRYYYCSYKTFIASYISSSFLLIYNSTRRSSFYIIGCVIVIVIINIYVAKRLIEDWQILRCNCANKIREFIYPSMNLVIVFIFMYKMKIFPWYWIQNRRWYEFGVTSTQSTF